MNSTLVIFFLSVQSSYTQNTEAPATEDAFDTVQFYGAETGFWRIKTYATDQDVHVWSLGKAVADLVALAHSSTEKHYGDVLTEGYIIKSEAGTEGLRRGFAERGLATDLEVSDSGFLFWAPEGNFYRSKSRPKERPTSRPEAQPTAPPNGGPATSVNNSGVTEGPPSVS